MAGLTNSTGATPAQRTGLFFWTLATVALLIFLGRSAIWSVEGFWIEVAREMAISQKYLQPTLNWNATPGLPFLHPWLVMLFTQTPPGAREYLTRLPSVLMALITLYGTISLGKQLFNRQIGLLTGWVLLSCGGFLFWGRAVSPDITVTTASVLACAYYFRARERNKFINYLIFYLFCLLAALAGGPFAGVLPIILVIPATIVENRWKRHLQFRHLLVILIFVSLYLLPFSLAKISASASDPEPSFCVAVSRLREICGENFYGYFDYHRIHPLSFGVSLLKILLPWTLVIAVGIAGMVYQRRKVSSDVICLAIGVLIAFGLFGLLGVGHWSGALPLAPFCALLGVAGITDIGKSNWNQPTLILMRYLVIIAGSLCLVIPTLLPLWMRIVRMHPPTMLVISLVVASILALLVMLLDNQPSLPIEHLTGLPPRLAATTLAGAILVIAVLSTTLPALTKFRTSKSYYQKLQDELAGIPPDAILFWGKDSLEPRGLFYLENNAPVQNASSQDAEENNNKLRKFLRDHAGRRIAIIASSKHSNWEKLETVAKELKLELTAKNPSYLEDVAFRCNHKWNQKATWVQEVPTYFKSKMK